MKRSDVDVISINEEEVQRHLRRLQLFLKLSLQALLLIDNEVMFLHWVIQISVHINPELRHLMLQTTHKEQLA